MIAYECMEGVGDAAPLLLLPHQECQIFIVPSAARGLSGFGGSGERGGGGEGSLELKPEVAIGR
jgi:hypothetical protein